MSIYNEEIRLSSLLFFFFFFLVLFKKAGDRTCILGYFVVCFVIKIKFKTMEHHYRLFLLY